jgi:uncharacterized RDD family membrane protein YckC
VARAIDTTIALIPMVVVFSWALIDGQQSTIESVTSTGAQVGYVAWALLAMGVFSATEGLLGTSPGKMLVGIRVVGQDLHPCGLGAGIARNLLLVIDGILSYQVGIMVMALSKNQMRVGDMAVKTLVVCKRSQNG